MTTKNFLKPKEKHKCVIYPDDRWKGYWDMYIIFMLLFTCAVTPYRLAFYIDEEDPLYW